MSHPRCPLCDKIIKSKIKRYGNVQGDKLIIINQSFPLKLSIPQGNIQICEKCYFQALVSFSQVLIIQTFSKKFFFIFLFLCKFSRGGERWMQSY
jgi:hypothetical protein